MNKQVKEVQLEHYKSYLKKLLFASIGLLIAVFGAVIGDHMTRAGVYMVVLFLINIPVYIISENKKKLEKELGVINE
jgi:hypothetical protein